MFFRICGEWFSTLGKGLAQPCSTQAAVEKAALGLGEEKAEELAAKLLKRKMENENIRRGTEFTISTGRKPSYSYSGRPSKQAEKR